jgi:hypothetical protein
MLILLTSKIQGRIALILLRMAGVMFLQRRDIIGAWNKVAGQFFFFILGKLGNFPSMTR